MGWDGMGRGAGGPDARASVSQSINHAPAPETRCCCCCCKKKKKKKKILSASPNVRLFGERNRKKKKKPAKKDIKNEPALDRLIPIPVDHGNPPSFLFFFPPHPHALLQVMLNDGHALL